MYLLSDGTTTKDIVRYVSDIIRLNMSIRPHQIPYFSGGTDDRITSINSNDIQSNISKIVSGVIDRIKSSLPEVAINIIQIDVSKNPIVIELDINGIRKSYDITNRTL